MAVATADEIECAGTAELLERDLIYVTGVSSPPRREAAREPSGTSSPPRRAPRSW